LQIIIDVAKGQKEISFFLYRVYSCSLWSYLNKSNFIAVSRL